MRSKIKAFCLLAFFIISFCFGQKQNNQWRFGGTGISFNSNPPVQVAGAALLTSEGSASVADRNTGALLFYTDGVTVWNAQNQPMPNGTGLLGGDPALLSSTTAAVIIPKPGSASQYYIVTIDEQFGGDGVCYSLVDMTLNGGLGDIVTGQKNISLFQTNSEKLEVVPASNGQDFWVITHDNPGNNFYSFLLTAAGFQSTPVISTIGGTHANGAGHFKINRQLNKLASGSPFNGFMELFDFNNATGVVSGPLSWNLTPAILNFSPLIYGVEFSPDGRLLYISNLNIVVQYNISLGTPLAIQNSAYQLFPASFGQPASLQLGPDGKIYLNNGNLDVINCPNKQGPACNYQATGLIGGGYGLPKWVFYPGDPPLADTNYIIYSDSCLNNGTQFTIFDTAGVTNVSWNFGDPVSGAANTATGLNVMHVFSQSGLYNVTAVVTGSCGNDTLLFGGLFIYACNSTYDGVILFTPDSCLQSNISFSLSNINNITNAAWNFGDPGSGVNNTSVFINPSHIFSDTGTYTITCIVTVNCGPPMFPCFFTDTVYKTIRIVDCNVPCDGSISSVGDSCLQSVVAFSVSGSQPVLNASWNFDDPASGNANTSSAVNPTHVFSDTGSYVVRCIVEFSCGTDTVFKAITVVDCDSLPAECKIFVPNAFTPNADNLNDKFSPIVNCPVDLFEFSIYNRWGQQVFRSTDPAVSWNGKYQGAGCPIGAYVYLINYKFPSQRKKQLKGSVMLLK